MCVCHTQFMEYALNVCCHMENRFIIILIISINSPSAHVQEKSNGKAQKAHLNKPIHTIADHLKQIAIHIGQIR